MSGLTFNPLWKRIGCFYSVARRRQHGYSPLSILAVPNGLHASICVGATYEPVRIIVGLKAAKISSFLGLEPPRSFLSLFWIGPPPIYPRGCVSCHKSLVFPWNTRMCSFQSWNAWYPLARSILTIPPIHRYYYFTTLLLVVEYRIQFLLILIV